MLDTNVVLDWLLFADPRATALAAAVVGGRLRWLACPAMRAELARMLAHPTLQRWAPDMPAALACFDAHARMHDAPAAAPRAGHPRCCDADDQVFVDLALEHGARWLLTHDRALLALARRVAVRGLVITTPQAWAAGGGAATLRPQPAMAG